MKTSKCNFLVIKCFIILLCFWILNIPGLTQDNKDILKIEKEQVIDSIAKLMTDKYVFPDKGKEMADLVMKKLSDGAYDDLKTHREFAEAVTSDLRSVTNDRHIGVIYAPERIAMEKKAEADGNDEELQAYRHRLLKAKNFGFEKIEILPGNVGYLKFNGFTDASEAGPTAVAAMNFLANSDALIIDLTENGGGSPTLIQLISSYFFDESEHLNSFYIREGDKTEQFWTLPYVPGPKMVNTDLYVLTSNYTFSGAEEFTYNLKNLKRATIVGETTGGGAHPVDRFILNDNFGISIPFGRAVNPITETNWEGTGVEPDYEVSKDDALEMAYKMALEKRLENETMKELKSEISWTLEDIKAKLEPFDLNREKMHEFTGVFGPRTITLEDGILFYQRDDRPKMQMIPMKQDFFKFNEIGYFRLHYIREKGKIIAVEGMYDNGKTDRNEKG